MNHAGLCRPDRPDLPDRRRAARYGGANAGAFGGAFGGANAGAFAGANGGAWGGVLREALFDRPRH